MDSLLKERKGFSLVELLVVIAVLVIVMGTAALTMGTSVRDSRVKKAAFVFKTMLVDGTKEAMANYKPVVVEQDSSFSSGIRLMMFLDNNENLNYDANERILAYFVVTGDKINPGRPGGYNGDYYFIPDVTISSATASGSTTLDLTQFYGTGFDAVKILGGNSKIIIRPEGVYVVRSGGSTISPGGLVLFRHTDDIDEGEQERQYLVLITKTFLRVLRLEDDGSGNFIPRELQ